MTKKQLEEMVRKILKEESSREIFIGVNEAPKFKKALDQLETMVRGYTKGETKKQAISALNVLYSLLPE